MLARLGVPLGGSCTVYYVSLLFFGGYLPAEFLAIDTGLSLESRREGEKSRGVTPTQSGAYPVVRAHKRAIKYLFLSLSIL